MEMTLLFLISVVLVIAFSPDIQDWILETLDKIFDDDNWPTGGRSTLTP